MLDATGEDVAPPAHDRDSLADGLAMSIAVGGAAVVGMASWLYVARTVPAAEVGRAAAFVAAFQVVAGCTEINLGVALLRWLPRAGGRTPTLLARCAVAVVALSAVVGALYLLVPGAATTLEALSGARPALVFVAACVGWAVFQQQDFVLVGLGRPWWAPARTGLFALTRVVVFVVAGGAVSAAVIVWSWLLPVAVSVAAAGVATVWWARPTPETGDEVLPERREVRDGTRVLRAIVRGHEVGLSGRALQGLRLSAGRDPLIPGPRGHPETTTPSDPVPRA